MLISDAALFVETISANPLDLSLVGKELGRADLNKLLREQLCKSLAKRLRKRHGLIGVTDPGSLPKNYAIIFADSM